MGLINEFIFRISGEVVVTGRDAKEALKEAKLSFFARPFDFIRFDTQITGHEIPRLLRASSLYVPKFAIKKVREIILEAPGFTIKSKGPKVLKAIVEALAAIIDETVMVVTPEQGLM